MSVSCSIYALSKSEVNFPVYCLLINNMFVQLSWLNLVSVALIFCLLYVTGYVCIRMFTFMCVYVYVSVCRRSIAAYFYDSKYKQRVKIYSDTTHHNI